MQPPIPFQYIKKAAKKYSFAASAAASSIAMEAKSVVNPRGSSPYDPQHEND